MQFIVLTTCQFDHLSDYLESNDLIKSSQFGFRGRYNAELVVTLLTGWIRFAKDQVKLTGAVFIDLQNSIWHGRALGAAIKLHFYIV